VKAAVCERYGPPEVVVVRETPAPKLREGEILVRVEATTVTTADARLRALRVPSGFGCLAPALFGFGAPRRGTLGVECAGVVDAVAGAGSRFRVGDRVVGMDGQSMGCHAEYKVFPFEGALVPMPPGLSFVEAASLPFGGMTALDFLRRGRLVAGERVLVVGAAGSVGSAAVQLAKAAGAHVTGVCSAGSRDLVRRLGADETIDYAHEDVTKLGARYDLVLDTVGSASIAQGTSILRPGGRLLLVAASLWQMLSAPWVRLVRQARIVAGPSSERREDLEKLVGLVGKRRLVPVVDGVFPFERVAEAHARVDGGHKRGSVVLAVGSEARDDLRGRRCEGARFGL
jgi:NADPH:quinone reductase-like Zn-dependent oxidoreductase